MKIKADEFNNRPLQYWIRASNGEEIIITHHSFFGKEFVLTCRPTTESSRKSLLENKEFYKT